MILGLSLLTTIRWGNSRQLTSVDGACSIAIEVNGKLLVDALYPGPYDTLYQTWDQWARTALGYALDRIAKLEQQRASDQVALAALRTDVQAALARISSIEADEVNDDAVDTTLLALVADLRQRVEDLEAL